MKRIKKEQICNMVYHNIIMLGYGKNLKVDDQIKWIKSIIKDTSTIDKVIFEKCTVNDVYNYMYNNCPTPHNHLYINIKENVIYCDFYPKKGDAQLNIYINNLDKENTIEI